MAETPFIPHLCRGKAREMWFVLSNIQQLMKNRSLSAGSEDSLLCTPSARKTSCTVYATTLLAGQVPISWEICNITVLPKYIYNSHSLEALKIKWIVLWGLYHVQQRVTRTRVGNLPSFACTCYTSLPREATADVHQLLICPSAAHSPQLKVRHSNP